MTKPILIVDDDRDVRESLRDTLHYEGYTTAEASDGGEALDYLRTNDVALVLLDWNMAPIDAPGFMAGLQDLDDRARKTPVACLTADSRITSRAQLDGYVACLKKPINLDKLFDLLRRYCGEPQTAG